MEISDISTETEVFNATHLPCNPCLWKASNWPSPWRATIDSTGKSKWISEEEKLPPPLLLALLPFGFPFMSTSLTKWPPPEDEEPDWPKSIDRIKINDPSLKHTNHRNDEGQGIHRIICFESISRYCQFGIRSYIKELEVHLHRRIPITHGFGLAGCNVLITWQKP